MKPVIFAAALTLAAGGAFAQAPTTTTTPPANKSPDTPAVTTQSTPVPARPAAGANSFTMEQARSRIQDSGFTGVSALTKDANGVWRGKASKNGTTHDVSLDYQGNVIAN